MKNHLFFYIFLSILTVFGTFFVANSLNPTSVSSLDYVDTSDFEQKQKIREESDSTPVIADTFSTAPVVNNTFYGGRGSVSAPNFRVTKVITSCPTSSCLVDENAAYGVVRWNNFHYAHSSLAFAPVKSLYVGDTFSITDLDGTTHLYSVSVRTVKEKSYLNGTGKTDGFTSGIYASRYNGKKYDVSLMTCGNGTNDDGNYRLLIFATKIA